MPKLDFMLNHLTIRKTLGLVKKKNILKIIRLS
ncbi:hypothetical protein L861_11820 [Litchfieldella anticariensis FP35 = DSM 16096]|uniref:Uncharacterized protein n=1 Tax=Litchfieldella anticariensis (strain DSM 16096 / CECT 5854 / CIP 108499 / LMG 22089 / FP35) TaxID=1121939 RepID=S2KH17_LITA3|nr:hypothetical protein L861_11820 [Halomonas anticariensis FP35 = DSM 16096]